MSLHNAVLEQYQVALDRLEKGGEEKSYTSYLYAQGLDKILKKCGEETFETVIAAKDADKGELLGELNDVIYHVTVLLCFRRVPLSDVLQAINRRCATQGLELDQLYQVIVDRQNAAEEQSYTRYLFEQGLNKVLKKVGEACSLLLLAAKNNDAAQTAEEAADLLYHLMVMMIVKDVCAAELEGELDRRSQKKSNLKTFRTTDVNT